MLTTPLQECHISHTLHLTTVLRYKESGETAGVHGRYNTDRCLPARDTMFCGTSVRIFLSTSRLHLILTLDAVGVPECMWCVQVLRSPKEAFAAAMQSWRERCEKMCMSTG